MIDFATLQGLTIPEGVVTQITDASGRVLWMLNTGGGAVILEVEKITSNTYVSSTSYTSEQFILLDIYPKTSNSTVKVTYGGLTKTLSFTGTNAKQVYFGTFGGVSDETETPSSGTLTIEGGCIGVGVGSYNSAKSTTAYCSCITAIAEFGGMSEIPDYAFYKCTNFINGILPDGITHIGNNAFGYTGITNLVIPNSVVSCGTVGNGSCFSNCTSLTSATIPKSITSMAAGLFLGCSNLTSVTLEEGLTAIGRSMFMSCTSLTNITIPSSVEKIGTKPFMGCTGLTNVNILAKTPPTAWDLNNDLGDGLYGEFFYNCTALTTITVPKGCGEAYKSAEYWSEYADYIVEAA